MHRKNSKRTVVQAGLLSAFRLMGVQALVVIFISAVWGLYRFDATLSVLLGGLVSIAPNVCFAYRFFNSGCQSDPQKIVRSFYSGELLKLAITVSLAIAIFMMWHILLLPFLTGLIGATVGLWSAPRVVVS